jgi:hypothetical protein
MSGSYILECGGLPPLFLGIDLSMPTFTSRDIDKLISKQRGWAKMPMDFGAFSKAIGILPNLKAAASRRTPKLKTHDPYLGYFSYKQIIYYDFDRLFLNCV